MGEMLSCCGLTCQTCPIYLATRQVDREVQTRMRAEIAKQCNERYGTQYAGEDITDCDGCKSEGARLFSASKNCQIRKCARDKKIENCAFCAEYACTTLATFFKNDPAAKERLDGIRNGTVRED